MARVTLGIIGIGNMGSAHARSIAEDQVPELELVAVADKRGSRRKWAQEKLGGDVRIYEDGLDLIKSGCCEAVLIAVPHYQHPELTIQALQHGLHVLCEKPAGVYTKQVREMNDVAAKQDRTFALMYNQRANCTYRKIHEMINSGELGRIRRVNWIITDWYRTQSYYESGSWRATWDGEGGGVLLNQCPHNLDLLQWLCGFPVKVKAYCHEGKWHDIEVEDDVTAYLEFENGATGVFVTTTGDAPGTNRLEITGELGKLVCENEKITFYRLEKNVKEHCATCKDGFEMPKVVVQVVETDGKNEQHIGVMKAFAANILRGEPLVAKGEEGIRGLMLSNAMHLSGWLGKEVTLPVDEELFLSELNKRRALSRQKDAKDITFDIEGAY